MSPDVSIIIPAQNEAKNIGRCLAAIFDQKTRYSFEVIVIDSGSEDDTVKIASRYPVKIIEIRPDEFDHGRTRNMGFEASSGEYLVTLVADAAPNDDRWLDELIAPFETDPTVAGTYSRQIPRAGSHPLASARFAGLDPSRLKPEIRAWVGDDVYENLDPMEKLKLVEFDDVSAARRRSVWERIPVAENYWAEDVDWSLKALRAGYKIAYAPQSVVTHSHAPSLRHDFKRAFVDQREASRRFGITLYANAGEAFSSWLRMVWRDWKTLYNAHPDPSRQLADFLRSHTEGMTSRRSGKLPQGIGMVTGAKIYWFAMTPVRRSIEVVGGYLAGKSPSDENIARDLYFEFAFTKRQGGIGKTIYSLGGKRVNTVFAHPPSEWSFSIEPRKGAWLEFLAGVHPDMSDKTAPVIFGVKINGEPSWSLELDPKNKPSDKKWNAGSVDLSKWEGKKIEVKLTTESADPQFAWAGWGAPRVIDDKGALIYQAAKRLTEKIERALTRTPPHHP